MLYQRVLQQKGIMLRISDRKLQRMDKAYQLACLKIIEVLIKVGAYPFTQVFSFTHVQQFQVLIVIFIAAGLVRYGLGYFREFFFGHCYMLPKFSTYCSLYAGAHCGIILRIFTEQSLISHVGELRVIE